MLKNLLQYVSTKAASIMDLSLWTSCWYDPSSAGMQSNIPLRRSTRVASVPRASGLLRHFFVASQWIPRTFSLLYSWMGIQRQNIRLLWSFKQIHQEPILQRKRPDQDYFLHMDRIYRIFLDTMDPRSVKGSTIQVHLWLAIPRRKVLFTAGLEGVNVFDETCHIVLRNKNQSNLYTLLTGSASSRGG